MSIFEHKRVWIGGGSGSWGQELTRQLLELNPKEIIIFSRGEISQVDMERTFNDSRLRFVIGDVRDREAVDRAMEGVDYVFQLAALKHVPICENLPMEAIQTNILGINNVIVSAIKHKVKKFVDVSTDKSVLANTTYGMTKAIGERLTIQANCITQNTELIVIRGGNVLGTNGSLVPYVIKQIKSGAKVKVTDPKMTRFFLTLPQAIKLLLFATKEGFGGETYVMNMPSFYILDLVKVLIDHYNPSTEIEIIGAREGEKVHEVLISEHEITRTWYVNQDYFCIMPQIDTGRIHYHSWMQEDYWDGTDMQVPTKAMTSETNLKSKEELISLLKEGGWLHDD